jgi:hypothetical protein
MTLKKCEVCGREFTGDLDCDSCPICLITGQDLEVFRDNAPRAITLKQLTGFVLLADAASKGLKGYAWQEFMDKWDALPTVKP